MTEVEKLDKLLTVNPDNEAFFLFDKWGLPIKKQGIEQPESIEQERLKQQQWSQNTLNLHLTGDPFFTYDPTPSIQCGRVIGRKFAENLVIQNQNPQVIQPEPETDIQIPPSPNSSNPITTPPSSVSTSSRSTPGSTPTGSPRNQGFKEDLWDLHSDSTQDSNSSKPSTSSIRQKNTALEASHNISSQK
jgi:hypothetical protein